MAVQLLVQVMHSEGTNLVQIANVISIGGIGHTCKFIYLFSNWYFACPKELPDYTDILCYQNIVEYNP